MEHRRPRLLRTYTGLRGRPGRGRGGGGGGGGGGRPGLRVLRPPAPWISPQLDPRRLFSTSSSGGASFSSSSAHEDPDFLPRKPPPRRKRKRKEGEKRGQKKKGPGAKENQGPPQKEEEEEEEVQEEEGPPTPGLPLPSALRRNITRRRRQQPPGNRIVGPSPAPLLSSTPRGPPLALPGETGEEGEGVVLRGSGPWLRRSCLRGHSGPEEGRPAWGDALAELSCVRMDPEEEEEEEEPAARESSLVLFEEEEENGAGRPWRASVPRPSPCHGRSLYAAFHSPSVARHRIWSDREGRVELPEGPESSPASSTPSPSRGTDPGQGLAATSKAPPLRGAFQLQATVCNDGKLSLTLPTNTAPLRDKRPQLSLPGTSVPRKKRPLKPNGAFPEDEGFLDQSSPWLQPVVLLDNQVVPSWLASHSARKSGAGARSGNKEHPSDSDSPGVLPGNSDAASHNQVVPVGGPGTTGRKACISGFSSNRWGQRTRLKRGGLKKRLPADASRLRGSFGRPKEDEPPFACPSSPDSSLQDASLWRRIRASFLFHKKKKILAEAESCERIAGTPSSARSHFTEVLRTPFTQTLGYSICPTSSLVLLSSVTSSWASPEGTLTDAEKVFGECRQKGPIAFEECIPGEKMRKCEKIGEGVFGEVFKTEGEAAGASVALKIIPIEGSDRVNGEPQKTFSDILPEIIISKELSLLAEEEEANHTCGFIRLHSVHCVRGAYPEALLGAWDQFRRRRGSENDRPDFFGDQQLFVVLEFEFGGTDLENMRRRQLGSVAAAKSILLQVTASLAVAEEALRFEHRDLHWGNVLVRKTPLKEVSVRLRGQRRLLPTHGVLVNIIDYTFSRLEKDGLTVYCDLSGDEEVFQGRGDYQFDVYRQMREENGNRWADYFPRSNVLWLHYLVDKLLQEVSYKKKATTSSLRQVHQELKRFSGEVLGFRSATEVLNASPFFQDGGQGSRQRR